MGQIISGRSLSRGVVEGTAIVTTQPFSLSSAFGIPLVSGTKKLKVADRTHELYNTDVTGKILVFPYAIGTTTLGFVLLETIVRKVGPIAIVCQRGEPLLSSGALCADIFFDLQFPIVDQISAEDFTKISTGATIRVDGDAGTVEIL